MLLVGSYVKLTKKPYESFPVTESMLGKVVKVRKHYLPGLKKDREILVGKASCCNEDVFDLEKGIHLAYARCKTKETKEKINKLTQELNYYTPAYWRV